MTDGLRDLAAEDVWLHSLERSRARRGLTPVGTAGVPVRDLTNPDYWVTSIDRSRRKREWRERQLRFGPLDSKRVAVPAALLAGGLAVTEVVGSTSGGGNAATAGTLPQDPVAANAASTHVIKHQTTKHRAAPPTAKTQTIANKTQAKPKKKKLVINTASEAQSLGGFKKGMQGPAVAQMQKSIGVAPDGIYGPQTLKAVHAFQKKYGLTTDGIVGPVTMKAIANPPKAAKTRSAVQHSHLSSGKTGNVHTASAKLLTHGTEVEQLQQRLGLAVDGDYGAKTEAAVKRWQRRHGLQDDGVVGPATWQALGLSGSNRTLHPHRFGETHQAVHHVSHQSSGSSGSSNSGGGNGGSSVGSSAVARAIAAANQIATLPYKWGGGHGSFQDSGYDCSGSVSYVLHGAGLLSSPLDSTGLESYGEPGPGKYITIYANSGHAFMTINGRRFDTGYGGEGNRWASGSRPTAGFVVRHPPGL